VRPRTIANSQAYWDRYYGDQFIAGLGTENILAALGRVPPRRTWLDLGAGSESLLWSIPLQADDLIAVDLAPERLAILRAYAAAEQPRAAYQTVLEFCDRSPADFATRCRRLSATLAADCLSGMPLPFAPAGVDLVTQFGLFGLTARPDQFLTCWKNAHAPLAADGWCAGANWNASASGQHRIRLNRRLYDEAFAATGITPSLITRVSITGDADFDSVWIYLGRKA
jgi:hypothetical protein